MRELPSLDQLNLNIQIADSLIAEDLSLLETDKELYQERIRNTQDHRAYLLAQIEAGNYRS